MAAVILGGCVTLTQHIEIKPALDNLPPHSPADLTIGVHYSPSFRTYEHIRFAGDWRYMAPIGRESAAMFDRLWGVSFRRAIPVERLPEPGELEADVDAILETRIEGFDFILGMEDATPEKSVAYRFIVYTRTGVPVHTWTVRGSRGGKFSRGFAVWNHINDDMEDAARNFLGGIDREIQRATVALSTMGSPPATPDDHGWEVTINASPSLGGLKPEEWLVLKADRYVPLRLTVTNRTAAPATLNPVFAYLAIPGQRLAPLPTTLVITGIDEASHKAGIIAGAVGMPFALVAILDEAKKSKERRTLQREQLAPLLAREATIAPGQAWEGLLVFHLPDGYAAPSASIIVWVTGARVDGTWPITRHVAVPPAPPRK